MKTRIVYCKRDGRPGDYANVAFDFLGYTFQPRLAKNRQKECFVGFLPAISAKAATAIRATIREWRLASTRNNQSLADLAQFVNPQIRGWVNYYGRFSRSKCVHVLRHLNAALAAWATELPTISASRTCVHALAGAHCATGPAALCPVAARRQAGGWIVGAG
jgi:RNA-directed DNA polymerase